MRAVVGSVVERSPDAAATEWCERRLLARIHRYTVNRLRAEIEPVAPRDLMSFLFAWPHQWAQLIEAPNWLETDLSALKYIDIDSPISGHPTIRTSWIQPTWCYGNTETFTLSTGWGWVGAGFAIGLCALGAVVLAQCLSPDAPAVDIYVNGKKAVSNVGFGTATGYLTVAPGSYDVRINVANTNTVVLTQQVTLARGEAYTALALGSAATPPVDTTVVKKPFEAKPASNDFDKYFGEAPKSDSPPQAPPT